MYAYSRKGCARVDSARSTIRFRLIVSPQPRALHAVTLVDSIIDGVSHEIAQRDPINCGASRETARSDEWEDKTHSAYVEPSLRDESCLT